MFSPRDSGKSDYISLNIHESGSFARGTSRSLWRVRIFSTTKCRKRIVTMSLHDRSRLPYSCLSFGYTSIFQQWNQLSRFQRNILYFAIITVLLVIFYLLPSETKAGTSDNEVDYSNVEVVQETAKYEKVRSIFRRALESVTQKYHITFYFTGSRWSCCR